tara:strand:- start:55 stop:285 length:231 start_codon:yes stop_codon:yes gene_type:complete
MSAKTKGAEWTDLKDRKCQACQSIMRPLLFYKSWVCDDYQDCGIMIEMSEAEVVSYQTYRKQLTDYFQNQLRRNEK